MKLYLSFLCLLFSGMAANAVTLTGAVPNRTQVPQYGLYQITLQLHTKALNPFNPQQIDVEGRFTSPTGQHRTIAGFLYQPFHSSDNTGLSNDTPSGPPVWLIRFSSGIIGKWKCIVTAKDAAGSARLAPLHFQIVHSKLHGPIEPDSANPHYFAYRHGGVFIPVGEDMCWAGQNGLADFNTWMPALHNAGGNWIRLWVINGKGGLEWSGAPPAAGSYNGYHGAGYYNLQQAWYMGRILDIAQRNHIQVMLCLDTYGELTTGGYFGEGEWPSNPYNIKNGGPCSTPQQIWTNPKAMHLYQRKLRYLAARFGWRNNLFAWEFWNEAPNIPLPWMRSMTDFLEGTGSWQGRPADPARHMVSTTYGYPSLWQLQGVNFSMSHNYGMGDIPDWAPVVHQDAKDNYSLNKPHLMAEFGIDWRKPDTAYDKNGNGINLHNAIWSAVASGDAGTAMIWWWDSYIQPLNLYHIWQPVSKFVHAIPWSQGRWQPVTCTPAQSRQKLTTYSSMTLNATVGWAKNPQPDAVIHQSGKIYGSVPGYLFSPAKPDLHSPTVFELNCPRSLNFTINISQVSNFAHIVVWLDNQQVKSVTLNAAPPAHGKPLYVSTSYESQYHIYLADYNYTITVHVPKGRHTLKLDLPDGDWVKLASFGITHYRSSKYPDMHLYAMSNGLQAFAWVQNSASNWKNSYYAAKLTTAPPAFTTLHCLPAGRYKLKWWNTETGNIASVTYAHAGKNGLTIPLPAILTDLAVQIVPRR